MTVGLIVVALTARFTVFTPPLVLAEESYSKKSQFLNLPLAVVSIDPLTLVAAEDWLVTPVLDEIVVRFPVAPLIKHSFYVA